MTALPIANQRSFIPKWGSFAPTWLRGDGWSTLAETVASASGGPGPPVRVSAAGLDRDLVSVVPKARAQLILVGVLILTFVSLSHWFGRLQRNLSWAGDASIARILGPVRVCEGRLSGGLLYAPYPTGFDGKSPEIAILLRSFQRADEPTDPQSETRVAILQLLQGNASKSTAQLEEIAARQPKNSTLQSDLSAAYLARAEKSGDPLDLLRAHATAERAVSLDNELPEARFNLALSLEKLFLTTDALSAWQQYLSVDRTSPWAAEARQHRDFLSQPTTRQVWNKSRPILEQAALNGDSIRVSELVSRFRQASRECGEEEVLGRWAEAMVKGDTSSALRELSLARMIGRALAITEHDSMVQNAVGAIDKATMHPDGNGLQNLAEGHLAFGRGLKDYKEENIQGARAEFLAAGSLFRSAGSPMVGWARFYVAICDYYALRYRHTLQSLRELENSLPLEPYPALRGRIFWMEGLSHFARTNLKDALGYFHRSLDTFERIGEPENVAAVSSMLANTYRYDGQSRKAWLCLYKALAARREIGSLRRLATILYDVADAATEAGYLSTAKRFHDDHIRVALAWGSASAVSEAFHRRSIAMSLLKDFDRAAEDLQSSEIYAKRVRDPGIRGRLLADLRLASAELKIQVAPEAAIRELSESIDFFKQAKFALRAPQALLSRARIYEERGSLQLAESDLDAAASMYRGKPGQKVSSELAGPVGKDAVEVFRELIDLRVTKQHDTIGGFDAAEEARSRVISDTLNSAELGTEQATLIRNVEADHDALSVPEIQQLLPERTILLEFVAVPSGYVAWLLDSRTILVTSLAVSVRDLAREIGDFRKAILSNSPEADKSAMILFDQVMKPALKLAKYEQNSRMKLVIVPDGILQEIPFAALKNRESNRYLVEDFDVGIAPSASLYVTQLGDSLPAEPKIASLGASTFPRGNYPWLPTLPGASREAERVAASYKTAKVLLGEEATPEAFWQSVADYDIVHFAGHALVNQALPLESRLLMGSGEITAFEFYGAQMSRVKLVVLSACSSAGGQTGSFQGLAGLSRALVVNGVPAVVATQWEVPDGGTSDLMVRFHQLVTKGKGPVAALSQAQREALAGAPASRKARNWAGVVAIGDFGER